MKTTYRIPTKEQYSYVEVEYDESLDEEEIARRYFILTEALKPKVGVSQKEFNGFLDAQLKNVGGDIEVYNRMSTEQKSVVQEVKKAIKRVTE